MATTVAPKLSQAELVEAINRAGGLVGVTAASRLIGIPSSNFKRVAPQLTAIKSDPKVYLKREVEALARRRNAARSSNGRRG